MMIAQRDDSEDGEVQQVELWRFHGIGVCCLLNTWLNTSHRFEALIPFS